MKFFLTIVSFFLLIFSACGQTETNATLACVDDNLAAFAEGLKTDFEKQLVELYGLENEATGEDYKRYVRDISEFKIPPTIFRSNPYQFAEMKSSPHFFQIWEWESKLNDKEEIEMALPPGTQLEKPENSIVLNHTSEFYACMIESIENEELRGGLKPLMGMGGRLSPGIIAGGFLALDDFEDEAAQLFMAISFYHNMRVMFEQVERG